MITSNRHWRQFRYRHEVPASILEGYLDWTNEDDCGGYIHYKGYWYHLSEFMRHSPHDDWHGSRADGFYSGVVIRLSEDGEEYQIGTWLAVDQIYLDHDWTTARAVRVMLEKGYA